jgi:hypothetical protein
MDSATMAADAKESTRPVRIETADATERNRPPDNRTPPAQIEMVRQFRSLVAALERNWALSAALMLAAIVALSVL